MRQPLEATSLMLVTALLSWSTVLVASSARGESRVQPSLTIYFQSTLKDEAHQQKTFKKVSAAWKAPATARSPRAGTKTVVRAVIAKGGRLVSTDISMSSGSKDWDAAVDKAVRAAAPYDPLPRSFPYPSYEAHFHMSYLAVAR
jgi:periplasmic protein TonB